jgi:hypothetical protein
VSKRLRLPPPPKEYSQEYEKVRNREIELVVNEKISDTDTGLYTGVPFVSAIGSNSAWSVPVGSTPIIVPFDSLIKDTDIAIDYDVGTYSAHCNYIVDASISADIYMPTSGGSTVFDTILQIYINGVIKYTTTRAVNTRDNVAVSISGMAISLPISVPIDIRMYHTNGAAVIFDLTLSRFNVSRMSQLPRL